MKEITTKTTDGISDYSDVGFSERMCSSNENNQILDPNNNNCSEKERVFYKCKNNCPGGNFKPGTNSQFQ